MHEEWDGEYRIKLVRTLNCTAACEMLGAFLFPRGLARLLHIITLLCMHNIVSCFFPQLVYVHSDCVHIYAMLVLLAIVQFSVAQYKYSKL